MQGGGIEELFSIASGFKRDWVYCMSVCGYRKQKGETQMEKGRYR